MKKHLRIITSTAAVSFLVSISCAQESTNQTGASAEFSSTAATNSQRVGSLGSTEKRSQATDRQTNSAVAVGENRTLNPDRERGTNHIGNYSTNAVITDANNSARNVRDRNDQTLTPGDQGNSPADLATTRQIRRQITSTKDISVSARNVKIITASGRVTLRGPVKTEQEKQLIGEVASKVAQGTNVDNQLEVKITPTGRN